MNWRVRALWKLARAFTMDKAPPLKEGYEWRSTKTGKHFIVNKKTGEIVGRHPEKSRKPVKSDSGKHFTQKKLDANMELAVNTLIGVKCKKEFFTPKITVNRVSDHANFRMLDRCIKPVDVKKALENADLVMYGNTINSYVYQHERIRIVMHTDGTIVTCIRIRKRKLK